MTTGADVVNLTVRGAVDREGVDRLRAVLVQAGRAAATLDLDLREVTEFPQLGLGVLVSARNVLGDRLRVFCSDDVYQLVEKAGLARVLRLAVVSVA